MRAYLVYAIILLIAITIAVQPAMAYTQMAIPFITTCDTIYMEPTKLSDSIIAEFNNVNIIGTSAHTLNIDFPAFADGVHLGPMVASGAAGIDGVTGIDRASFNVLPFGPVNLAFPSIGQTADDTYTYQRTYFFTDTRI